MSTCLNVILLTSLLEWQYWYLYSTFFPEYSLDNVTLTLNSFLQWSLFNNLAKRRVVKV